MSKSIPAAFKKQSKRVVPYDVVSVSRGKSKAGPNPINEDDLARLQKSDPVFAWLVNLPDATVKEIENVARENRAVIRRPRPSRSV